MHEYLRHKKRFPHLWCSGCGIGTIMGAIIRAIADCELDRDSVVMVSGIGCSSRMPIYVDFNTLHTTHGRPIAFATGIKLARPELEVIVVTGDGDVAAIGGNHLIHACRRNINLTVVCINNNIYGMTGGQASPTTPQGKVATTARYGDFERAFDLCDLTAGAGAVFVARGAVYYARQLEKLVAQAIRKKGFAFVDVISQCPTYYGRFNKFKSPVEMLYWQRDNTVNVKAAPKMKPEELEGKLITGVLADRDYPEFTELYDELIADLAAGRK
ncbi:MAG: 2-oxoacid:ferredoxin oxidoreductase subunit beta [candidate division Zixibacteria bacterium]|nr:2-oxoacid:ferredoxin oxidoreductase subunit beta [candidate division Zixibacteria bacterium]